MVTSKLFQPVLVGDIELSHRIVYAPTTRLRADANHVPLPLVAEYYQQRASTPGSLLISEATFIAARAGGYKHAPGIWSEEQIAAWKKVSSSFFSIHLVLVTEMRNRSLTRCTQKAHICISNYGPWVELPR